MKQKVIITRGLPASGKSTWSKKLTEDHPEFKRINRDDLRLMMYQGAWSEEREEAVLFARRMLVDAFLTLGYSIVLDDTNLVPKRFKETLEMIREWEEINDRKVEIEVKEFIDVPLEVCIARNAQRPDLTRVPEDFIRDYYKKYILTP